MQSVLETIAAYAKARSAAAQAVIPPAEMRRAAHARAAARFAVGADGEADGANGRAFYGGRAGAFGAALRRDGVRLIAEIKRASPSKGLIDEDFDYLSLAGQYAGADAVSVLTEPRYFMGGMDVLIGVRAQNLLPILRKDFISDEYEVCRSAAAGADAVLLIAAILDDRTLKDLLSLCRSLGLDGLVETRDTAEIDRALNAGAEIVGVNSRDLTDFTVDVDRCAKLLSAIPSDVVRVFESGITSPAGVLAAKEAGADAVLVGSAVMGAADKPGFIRSLRAAGGCLSGQSGGRYASG